MHEQQQSSTRLYESREVLALLEERGAHMDREGLSSLSDRAGLVTRPPVHRCPRRWTMAQIEFLAATVRLWRHPSPIDAVAALAAGDEAELARYVDELRAQAAVVADLAPAARHDANLHVEIPTSGSLARRETTAA